MAETGLPTSGSLVFLESCFFLVFLFFTFFFCCPWRWGVLASRFRVRTHVYVRSSWHVEGIPARDPWPTLDEILNESDLPPKGLVIDRNSYWRVLVSPARAVLIPFPFPFSPCLALFPAAADLFPPGRDAPLSTRLCPHRSCAWV